MHRVHGFCSQGFDIRAGLTSVLGTWAKEKALLADEALQVFLVHCNSFCAKIMMMEFADEELCGFQLWSFYTFASHDEIGDSIIMCRILEMVLISFQLHK